MLLELTFLDPPLVRELPDGIIFRIGELAILSCEVKGATEPSVSWTKDRDTSIPRAKFQNNGRVLVIKSVLPRDSGLYECKASNEFGESSMSTTVIVVGKFTASNKELKWEGLRSGKLKVC